MLREWCAVVSTLGAGMILPWIRRRGSGLARRAAARFRRSVAEARSPGARTARPPLRLGGTTHGSSEPLVRRMGRRERRSRDRHRIFWRPDDARMGATLYELAPG